MVSNSDKISGDQPCQSGTEGSCFRTLTPWWQGQRWFLKCGTSALGWCVWLP